MSRSATPATRNEATTRLKPPKRTTSAKLPIGTAIRGSRERLRTVANGCDRERNVERTHPQPPDPQSETGTLATHSGKNDVGPLHQLLWVWWALDPRPSNHPPHCSHSRRRGDSPSAPRGRQLRYPRVFGRVHGKWLRRFFGCSQLFLNIYIYNLFEVKHQKLGFRSPTFIKGLVSSR